MKPPTVNGNFEPNNKYKTLDEVLSSADRTFDVAGTIHTFDATNLNNKLNDVSIKDACDKSNTNLKVISLTPAEAERLNFTI